MNNSQQYISDYLNCGMMHFRTALTPMDRTGDPSKDKAFREELLKHCEQSQYWEEGSRASSHYGSSYHTCDYFNKTLDLVIVFSPECGGISHNY